MAAKIIKGNDLMMFDKEGNSYAYATNHTFSMSAEVSDTSSKDHGLWGGSEVTKYSWEITTENLYTVADYDTLFTAMISTEPIKIRFGLKAENDPTKTVADGDYDNWTAAAGYYEGDCHITSLVANANTGENATYSVTFTGSGKIIKSA